MQGHHLAELNVGRLRAAPGDPLIAEFMDNLDRVNGLGKRMPGFIWMMEGSGEPGIGNTEAKIDGDPLYVSNLTVWSDAASLERFVWGTVHKQFYTRRAEWFQLLQDQHFVMWWVPEGHRPTLDEGLERLAHRRDHGDTDQAFGWDYLEGADMHKTHGCGEAAE